MNDGTCLLLVNNVIGIIMRIRIKELEFCLKQFAFHTEFALKWWHSITVTLVSRFRAG